MHAYLRPVEDVHRPAYEADAFQPDPEAGVAPQSDGDGEAMPAIDRTAKLYVGGKQKRPDGGYAYPVRDAAGRAVGEAGLGNRKDVRDAVEAAHAAKGWATTTAHNRAQVLYYLAENLAARSDAFEERLRTLTGATDEAAAREVRESVERLFAYAAWSDKLDGEVHAVPMRAVTLAMKEPHGVVGVACPDEAPLLALISLTAPLLALGNRVVAIPSPRWPLLATDLYQVLDASDLPGGALNLVTGARDPLASVLADHDDVQALWYVGPGTGAEDMERRSAGNLKVTWTNQGRRIDWTASEAYGETWLQRAYRVKNVWVPYGV